MDAHEFEQTLEDCEIRLDRLRALYEQYFQGLERLEPLIPKKELQRRVQLLRGNVPRNTRLRFRFQMMVSKYTTYQNYWQRVARQIEEGTYRRDIMKARRRREDAREARREEAARPDNPADGISLDIDIDATDFEEEIAAASAAASALTSEPRPPLFAPDDVLSAIDNLSPRSLHPHAGKKPSLSPFGAPNKIGGLARPLTPLLTSPPRPKPKKDESTDEGPPSRTFAKPYSVRPVAPHIPTPKVEVVPTQARPAPTSRVAGGPDEEGMRKVYQRYVEARERNNERVDNVRFENVKQSIEKQLPTLRAKHKGKNIDFEVVIRNGKVGLKPVPK
jgi:hypothetical protein